jgi:2-oxoglutarate dehydrogenase E2 component (dihydrolipoamide succinyltransferase)
MSETTDILAPIEQEGTKSVVRAWLKGVGDAVKRDEPLVELETDKVAVEVPAPADGVLSAIALNEGDEAAPGATLGVLSLVIPDATKSRSGTQGRQSRDPGPRGRRRIGGP